MQNMHMKMQIKADVDPKRGICKLLFDYPAFHGLANSYEPGSQLTPLFSDKHITVANFSSFFSLSSHSHSNICQRITKYHSITKTTTNRKNGFHLRTSPPPSSPPLPPIPPVPLTLPSRSSTPKNRNSTCHTIYPPTCP